MILHLLCALTGKKLCVRCVVRETRRIWDAGVAYLDES